MELFPRPRVSIPSSYATRMIDTVTGNTTDTG